MLTAAIITLVVVRIVAAAMAHSKLNAPASVPASLRASPPVEIEARAAIRRHAATGEMLH